MAQGSGRRRLGALALAVFASALFVAQAVGPVASLPLPATLVSITVAPAGASITVSGTQQYAATGHYSDLSTQDLTGSVTWASSDSSVATISNAAGTRGKATGVATGGVTITATSGTTSGTALLSVTPLPPPPVTLVSITVAPAGASIVVGGTQQYSATGNYSDLTTQDLTASVTWASSDSSVATISNAAGTRGLATGVATGGVTITATSGTTSGTALLAVTALPPPPVTLLSIAVSPPVATVAIGAHQQFTATGTYSDLSTHDITTSVTWSSSASGTATVSNASGTRGRATGVAAGPATITATDTATGVFGDAALTVTPPVVLPPPPPPPGTTRSITVVPSAGRPGSRVTIVGVKFPPNSKVRVSYRTGGHPRQVKLCKTTVAVDGAFRCQGLIPGAAKAGAAGTHVIAAKILKAKGTPSVTTNFTLIP